MEGEEQVGDHLCGPGGASGIHCRMQHRNRTWEETNLGQILLLVSLGKLCLHSEPQLF